MAALHHTAAHARAHGTHECLSRQRLVEVRSTVGTQRVPPRSGATKGAPRAAVPPPFIRSEEHTSELQSLMRISYAVFCLKKKKREYRELRRQKYIYELKSQTQK